MTDSETRPWRSSAVITVVALALLGVYCILPRGGRLTHMDFLADDATVLELCNPLNPAPLPVATGSLPVTMSFSPLVEVEFPGLPTVSFDLTTVSGRPVEADDLETIDGKKIRLTTDMGIPALPSFVAPAGAWPSPYPGHPGRWCFSISPVEPSPLRIIATFTPVSTGKPITISANLYYRAATP